MAASFTQSATSLFKITTPLGTDKVLLRGFRGSEGISRLFRFELDLLSEDPNINYADIIGKNVTISLTQSSGTPRYFNGVISRFGQGAAEGVFATYHAEMVPWLWLLTRSANCRIFQNKSIPDILKDVFGGVASSTFTNSLKGTFKPREYCVQYRETDFNFVSRLMEESGIFYFFQHDMGKHTLVLANDPSGNADCPGQSSFEYYIESTAVLDVDVVQSWQAEQELRTGNYSLTDYNFETPSSNLFASTPTVDSVGGNSKFTTYDYPGKYLTQSDGTALTKIRMQEEESVYKVFHGTSDARSMTSGYKFTLKDYYRDDMNTSYLLTDLQHNAHTTSYGTSQGAQEDHYSNSFRCIPASVPFRPLRLTPRPTIQGPQTAVVVGKSGDEICIDKYGRAKVQFYWDQLGKKDDNSSCWIRVSNVLAGKGWGSAFHPRVGQEVIVDFLEGDPDQPVITGRLYNADQMPPGSLPSQMNLSGIRTHSTKGGGDHDANLIAFDDTKGSELVYLTAQKDMSFWAKNNEIHNVRNDQTITVHNNRTETVEEGNEAVTIKQGNRDHTISQGNESLTVSQGTRTVTVQGDDTHTVKTGDRVVTVNTGKDTHTVKTGDRSVEVSMGNDSLTVKMGNQTTKLNLGAASTEAMQSITLTVGQNSIKIDQMGVTIQGMMVSIQGQVQTQIQGLMTQVQGNAMLQCSGPIIMIGP